MDLSRAVEDRDDVSFFDEAFRLHNRPVYAYLRGRCGEADTAADLLQETYLRAWRHLEELRRVPADKRLYWLLTVARNVAHDHHRRQAVRDPFALPLPEMLPSDEKAHDPAAAAEATLSANELEQAIGRLPEDLRLVISLRYLGEMNSAEIAEALDRPAGTVRYQLSHARALLARELGPRLTCQAIHEENR